MQTVMHRYCEMRPKDAARNRPLPWSHSGRQRTGRLQVRKVHYRTVDGQKCNVKGTIPLCDAPPGAVKHGVPAMKNSESLSFDDPIDLRVTKSVNCRCCSYAEWPRVQFLPLAHDLTAQILFDECRFSRCSPNVFVGRASRRCGPQDKPSGFERGGK